MATTDNTQVKEVVPSTTEDRTGFNSMAALLSQNLGEVTADTSVKEVPKVETTEKKPEAKTAEPDIEIPTNISPKASENFKALKKSRDEFKAKLEAIENGDLKTLRAELEKLKSAPVQVADTSNLTKELETLKAERETLANERDELSKIVQVKAVENHPKFKAYFDKKINSAIEVAKSIVGTELAANVEAALKMQDGAAKDTALEDILSNLSTVKAGMFASALTELNRVHQERNGELAKAQQHYQTLEAESQAENTKRQEQQKADMAAGLKMAEEASAKFEGFKEIEGDAAHNAEVANRKQFIKEFFAGNVKKEMIPMIPVMVGDYLYYKNSVIPGKDAKIATLEKQLSELQAASPRADGGKTSAPAAAEGQADPALGFAENYRRLMGK